MPISATRPSPSCASCRRRSAPRPHSRDRRRGRSRAEPLTHEVAHIADPGLRDALARLGADVRAGR